MAHPGGTWRVRSVTAADHDRWRVLYAAYAAFYRVDQTDAQAERTWGWLLDPLHEVEGVLVVDGTGRAAGLAHVRPFARPLSASVGGFLDDLYVDEPARGTGAVDALLQALQALAAERGWSVLRWITAADNARARGKYDQVAVATDWVTYDLQPAPSATGRTVVEVPTTLHLSQRVRRPAPVAYAFAHDPANLPVWAAGLGGTFVRVDGQWRMPSPDGDVVLQPAPDNELGVLDHTVVLPDGAAVLNPMRVLADGDDACEVVFTLRRRPEMSDEDFARDAAAVVQDLRTLAQVLEAQPVT